MEVRDELCTAAAPKERGPITGCVGGWVGLRAVLVGMKMRKL
jgi:hypothetical protein